MSDKYAAGGYVKNFALPKDIGCIYRIPANHPLFENVKQVNTEPHGKTVNISISVNHPPK